jgi:protein-S-isoprenylcysteine O-methyltransferase Ste14
VTAALALAVYSAGLGFAFGWRSLVQRRRTGDTGLRLDAGTPGSIGWWAKTAFLLALLLGFAGPAAALAGLDPIAVLNRTGLTVAGMITAAVGVVATLVAQVGMGTSWRVGVDPAERTDLVTSGPFAVARNPIFSAMVITSIGLALAMPNVLSMAATLLLIAAVQVQVRAVEEPYLAQVHGRVYVDYARRVGRFAPGIGRIDALV